MSLTLGAYIYNVPNPYGTAYLSYTQCCFSIIIINPWCTCTVRVRLVGSVCVSVCVTQHLTYLTYRMFIRPKNDTTYMYLTGNEEILCGFLRKFSVAKLEHFQYSMAIDFLLRGKHACVLYLTTWWKRPFCFHFGEKTYWSFASSHWH